MGKGIFFILILFLSFSFFEDAKAHVWSCKKFEWQEKNATVDVLSSKTDAYPPAIKEQAKRILSASRSCHIIKYTGSSGIALSVSMAVYRQVLPGEGGSTVAKSNHLSHIYPFHNFW